ncbi:MAG TPA: 30S ribosomal protein S7 [Candidatus Thermoplasmatota archaeon]|nr:30S ribosomal protein S7 [Candidatus Thermoplasmatota archaeon]
MELWKGAPPLLFGKWDLREITLRDPGLRRYINLQPVYLPHTSARHANRPFAKSHTNLVERLINVMMKSEDYTGKKSKSYRVVRDALFEVEAKMKQNPVQVLVRAVENAAPREEVTRLRYGGISVPKAVDVSPARRLDIALRNIATAANNASFKSPKAAHECLANEIIRASRNEMESAAIAKKEELERVAKSAR